MSMHFLERLHFKRKGKFDAFYQWDINWVWSYLRFRQSYCDSLPYFTFLPVHQKSNGRFNVFRSWICHISLGEGLRWNYFLYSVCNARFPIVILIVFSQIRAENGTPVGWSQINWIRRLDEVCDHRHTTQYHLKIRLVLRYIQPPLKFHNWFFDISNRLLWQILKVVASLYI